MGRRRKADADAAPEAAGTVDAVDGDGVVTQQDAPGWDLPPGLPEGSVIRKKFTQELPCPLDENDPKLREKSNELAGVILERLAVLEEKRDANAKFREQVVAYNERERDLAHEVKKKVEMRPVRCIDVLLPTNEMRTIRLDDGSVVGKPRTADPRDLQDELFDGDEVAAATEPPPPPSGDSAGAAAGSEGDAPN